MHLTDQPQPNLAQKPSSSEVSLSISLVIYYPKWSILEQTLLTLDTALKQASQYPAELYLINNGDNHQELNDFILGLSAIRQLSYTLHCKQGHGNVGYAAGHNLVLEKTSPNYHLILNPDVYLQPQALRNALQFLEQHPEIGLLSPSIMDEQGIFQYANRRYPSLMVLFLRGFAPSFLKKCFSKYLARYEMQDCLTPEQQYLNPLIHSGCFMLFRADVLKQLKGFDEDFFLYFEDYDLSIRCNKITQSIYFPKCKITHLGGNSAKKGRQHIYYFIQSAKIFFKKHGWKVF